MSLEVLAIAVLIAWAAAIPGIFLVPRKMTLMADAITHSVLPGLVIGYLLGSTLDGPLPLLGAVAASLLTVWLTETLSQTRLVKNDAAIGMVFPAMFSLGVLLVASFADQVHLDTDAVLLGELAFAPLDRVSLGGLSLPRSLLTALALLGCNLAWSLLFFKELKLATFDPGLARSLGISPTLVHYGLMTAVSLTAVGSFDAVGSILVVAFVVAPAASAYLLLDSLEAMAVMAPLLGGAGAAAGYGLAYLTDTTIAGAIAVVQGLIFTLVFLFNPKRGIVSTALRRRALARDFGVRMLVVHLSHHQGGPEASRECRADHLSSHLRWGQAKARAMVALALDRGLITLTGGSLALTSRGHQAAIEEF